MFTFPTTFFKSGAAYDAEAQALFDRMDVQPDATRKTAINNFIVGIKADEGLAVLDDAFDCIWFTAAHAQQASRLNWVKNAHNITEVNAPTWTLDRGYTGNASTMYLDTNYNPVTQGVNFTQNNDAFGAYLRTDADSVFFEIAQINSSDVGCLVSPVQGGNFYTRNNSSEVTSGANASSLGLFSTTRTASGSFDSFKNGNLFSSVASVSVAPLSFNFYILAANKAGSAAYLSSRQSSFAYIGSGNINQLNLYNRVQTYLTALGAQV